MKRRIPQVLFYILSVICLALCISGGVILNRENHEHVAEFVPAAAPTCAVEGNIEHWRCRECGLRFKDELTLEEIAAADTVIEALPHTEEIIQGTPATCTQTGLSDGKRCTVCKNVTKQQTVIPTLPHSEEYVKGFASTCVKTGLSDGRRCTVCNHVTVEQTITPTIPHTEETIQGTPATCTQTGLSDGKRCTVCKNVTKQQTVIPTLPHSEEYVKGFASTCVKTGLSDGRRCTVCHTITLEQTEIPLIPHNETIIKGTPATCTQTGISDGKRCTVCRTVTVEQTVLALIAHTPAHMEETQSTCAKRGNIEFWKCGSCKNGFAEEACVTKLTEDEIYKPLAEHPYKLCFDDTRHFKLPTCGHDAEEKDGAEHTYDGRTCTDCGFCNYGVVYTLNTDGLSYSVTDLKSTANRDEIEVYAEYGGLPVTEIAQNAFNTEYITALTLPDSITKICKGAIDNCNYLTALHVPKNATLIQGAVTDCDALVELTVAAENASYVSVNNCIIHKSSKTLILGCKNSIIPANGSVTKIGDYAFDGCGGLTEISIPNSVTSIGNYAFRNCTNITEISIPDSVTTIGNYAFYSCNLLNLNIADGVKNIGNYAFRYCSKLTQITLPESVKSIGSYAFSNCTSLTTINIPANVTAINSYTFNNCGSLTTISLPENIKSIGFGAFENCTNLSEINMQSGVTRINANAFKNCKSLKKVNFPASVEYIASDVFINCGGLEELTVEAGNINYSGVNNCIIDKRSDTLILGCKNSVIPSDGSVTSIGEYAFRGCTQLISIHIPASVTTIAGGAFTGMTSLGEITVAPENSNYYVKDNCLIEKSSKTLVLGCKGSIVPTDGSVTKIGNYAFDGCIELTDITIPKSLTHIGISAFNNTDVKNLYLEDLESWLKVTFRNADGVYLCSPLQNGGNIYVNGELLTEFTVPDGIDEIPMYAFYNCLSLTKIVIPNHVKEVNSAFYGCANVNEIIVGDGITDWNYYSSFKKLKTITLGKGITEIRTNAFLSLTQLSSVTLGENITEIGSNAFMRCSSLTQLTLNKNLQTIGNNAFRLCSGLTEIELPDSLQSLGSYVFSNCTCLTTVTIPQGVDKLYSTFSNCSALKDIYFKGTREQWEAIPKSNWDYGTGEYTIHFIDGTTLNKGEA